MTALTYTEESTSHHYQVLRVQPNGNTHYPNASNGTLTLKATVITETSEVLAHVNEHYRAKNIRGGYLHTQWLLAKFTAEGRLCLDRVDGTTLYLLPTATYDQP